jgi:hypothetical protein
VRGECGEVQRVRGPDQAAAAGAVQELQSAAGEDEHEAAAQVRQKRQ